MAIGSIKNFIRELGTHKLDPGFSRFYRGQASQFWNLIPSILRHDKTELLKHEYKILQELNINYPDTFNFCENLFEQLALAQHYGIPTRLLDITSNPLVALFFSCYRKQSKSGNSIVYILDIPNKDIYYYNSEFINNQIKQSMNPSFDNQTNNNKNIFCVKARLNNPRIVKQHGAMLLFNYKNNNNPDKIIKIKTIEIDKSHVNNILKELNTLSISSISLFPEITQYAYDLKTGNIQL